MDTAGNCLFVLLYPDSVGAYLQAAHACFGIGALLAPLLVDAASLRGESADGDAVAEWGVVLFGTGALLLLLCVALACLDSPSAAPPRQRSRRATRHGSRARLRPPLRTAWQRRLRLPQDRLKRHRQSVKSQSQRPRRRRMQGRRVRPVLPAARRPLPPPTVPPTVLPTGAWCA